MEEKKIGKRRHDEENFLPLKHYKYSTCLDRDHRISERPNVPNVLVMSGSYTHTHSYIPLQGQMPITDNES